MEEKYKGMREMMTKDIRKTIDNARDVLVGKIPNPQSQIEQITIAMIYKFMDDMDIESVELGGERQFFTGEMEEFAWSKLMSTQLGAEAKMNLYTLALDKLPLTNSIPKLFRDIFKGAYLPFRDGQTLTLFLKEINEISYDNSENLGNAFEYLLSIMGSQGDAGQFRTPRHIIDFIVNIVKPTKNDKILDPACGTAGFLISAYKYIIETAKNADIMLAPKELNDLTNNIQGYDISPDMVKLALVNMYLHKFKEPKIYEYDTLTKLDRWDDYFDVILANPPFMTPKGGIQPHNRFGVKANRSEVLFVDYIMEHLNTVGRAGVIVPEGIVFQSANAYKELRKKLVDENYLYAVVSLPSGVFQPYSGVKTSILLMDKQLAKKTDKILFVEIQNDGFDLGAQRREIDKNDLPQATEFINQWQNAINTHSEFSIESKMITLVEKSKIAENEEYNLTASRYKVIKDYSNCKWDMVKLGDVCSFQTGSRQKGGALSEGIPSIGGEQISVDGNICIGKMKYISVEHYKTMAKGILNKFDVLLVKDGATTGKTGIYKNEFKNAAINEHVFILRANTNILPIYLYYTIKSKDFQNKLKRYIKGIIGGISLEIKEIQIPLPPLEVQEEIVKELDGYQAIIDGAQKVIDNWHPTIPTNPNWQKVKLSDYVTYSQGVQVDLDLQKKEPQKDYDKFLRIENYTQNSKDFRYIPKELSKGKYVNEKDVVVVRYGATAGFIGRSFAGVLANNLFVLNIKDQNKLSESYLYYAMVDETVSKFIKEKSFGGGMPALSFKIMDMVEILLPSLKEQQKIVSEIEKEEQMVSSCKQLIELYKQKIDSKIKSIWEGGE